MEIIQGYNDGSIIPLNYDETYIATKHIQRATLQLPDKIIELFKNEILDAGLFLDDITVLKEIIVGLIKGNIILQGPPGTGKTTLVSIISKIFNVNYDIITAVSDWTTYDTIGGLQPATDEEGNEIITGKNGRVVESIVKCCNTVLSNINYNYKEQATWLVIDELNRSEIDKVFGDLFTVFGSSDIENRKIPLWFETDINKKVLYVPLRFRIIGLMNNIDKNYVFDISQGLARRFTIINILPPKIENFELEIENCKKIILNKLINKLGSIGSKQLEHENIEKIIEDLEFKSVEDDLKDFLKHIRYEGDESYLGLQYGTAQIIDLYENIILHIILDDCIGAKLKIQEIFDSSVNNIIMPQLDGYDYLKLKKFADCIEKNSKYLSFNKSKKTLNSLI